MIVCRTVEFRRVDELVAAADVVVLAGVSDLPLVEREHGHMWTTTTPLRVERVLKGGASGRIRLQQLGRPPGHDRLPVLTPGADYLLFLRLFVRDRTVGPLAPDLYVVVGVVAGMWRRDGAVFTKLDLESPDLPDAISAADLEAATA